MLQQSDIFRGNKGDPELRKLFGIIDQLDQSEDKIEQMLSDLISLMKSNDAIERKN